MVVLRDSGELESDEPIEQSSFEEMNCSYSSPPTTYSSLWSFPPSPPFFHLHLQASPPPPPSSSTSSRYHCVRSKLTLFRDFQNQQDEDIADLAVVDLVVFVDYLIQDRGGELNVINGLEGGALNVIYNRESSAFGGKAIYEALSLGKFNRLEHQHEDIVDQLVIDFAGVDHVVLGYRGGKLDVISGGGIFTMNGVEYSAGQALSTTPEPSAVIFAAKLSVRVWLGQLGQWVADIRYGWNWLNMGSFRTAEGAPLPIESVKRWRGGKDLFDYPTLLIENELVPLQFPPTAQEENHDGGIGCEGTGDCAMADQAQFNSGCLEKKKAREKNPGGERRNKKANGVRIAIPLDDILQAKGMCLNDAAKHLKVSITNLKSSCRDYGISRWPPRITVPSNQALTATIDTNSVVEKEIPLPQFLPTTQQENLDAGFGNYETETIGMAVEGTLEAVMEETQLNSECSGKKGKRKVNTPRGERGNNRTTGVRIAIPKEDIIQAKGMRIEDAAKHLEVSKSTLKRVCREYGIYKWPPRKEQELIGQSRPNKSPAVVDQEQIPQLNPDTLLSSNQVRATSDTYSVKVKVRCEEGTIMFRLSCPWRKVELEQQVKERLSFEAGTYKIEYKDEDDELILINCDKDLEECISSSSAGGSRSIELFLKLK